MENIKTFIKSKAFILIPLYVGCFSLLFIGQEKQYGIFAWIAPIFLLHFSRRVKPIHFLHMFLLLIIAGLITQKTHNLFNDPVFGLINGIAYALVNITIYITDRLLFVKSKKFVQTLIFPSVYVIIEVLVTSALGISGVLALSQFSFTPLAQLSTITGIHGITFIICWFASIIYWIYENEFNPIFIKKGFISFAIVFIIILCFGGIRMTLQTEVQEKIKVATVSGPFDLHQMAKKEKDALLQLSETPGMKIPSSFFSSEKDIWVQLSNTKKAAELGAKIIVWSEGALFVNQKQLNTIVSEVKSISKKIGVYILIAFFEENNSNAPKPINNKSILIGKDGNIKWNYKKAHPTPAEMPLVNAGDYNIPIVETEYGIIGNVICYDYDFPLFLKQANKRNVDIMLVPAYDWLEFAQLHTQMAQFETLQSGRALIRANGNGLNIITDNRGSIISQLNTFTNNDRILLSDLPLVSLPTVYAKNGNSFILLCIICFVVSIILRIIALLKFNKESR